MNCWTLWRTALALAAAHDQTRWPEVGPSGNRPDFYAASLADGVAVLSIPSHEFHDPAKDPDDRSTCPLWSHLRVLQEN
jgi:hypothetical protein